MLYSYEVTCSIYAKHVLHLDTFHEGQLDLGKAKQFYVSILLLECPWPAHSLSYCTQLPRVHPIREGVIANVIRVNGTTMYCKVKEKIVNTSRRYSLRSRRK